MQILIIFFAKYLYLVLLVLAVVSVYLLPSDLKKKTGLLAVFSLPLSLLIGKILNHFIYNPRPFVVEKIQPLIAHAADNGFPSDHTLLCATVSAIVFVFNKKWGSFLFVLTLLVGFSRVLASVHHPVDIAASILISLVSVSISCLILKLAKVL